MKSSKARCHFTTRTTAAALFGLTRLTIAAAPEAVPAAYAAEKYDDAAAWSRVGRDLQQSFSSPLSDIQASNVHRLGLAWYLDLPNEGSLEATPLMIEGALYFSGSNGSVYSVDARTGKQRWRFDPDLAHHPVDQENALFGGNRGVAYWQGKVFVGTTDGRLVAIDSRTGRAVWSVPVFDEATGHGLITGAPRAFNGKVLIGFGGEHHTRGAVSAYDADTGKRLWRFFTVPGDPAKGFENAAMAMAARTWNGSWWKAGANGTVWDAILYDPDLNRLYIGTANGNPLDADTRSPGRGDNLFVASIIALDADTGTYIWHYQLNPGDSWDYDACEPMVAADLAIEGQIRKVLMQAPKNGFFYVIDRVTGKLLSAEAFTKVNWAEHIDLESGRPVENPNSHYDHDTAVLWPNPAGGHAWQPMAFNARLGLVYIPVQRLGWRIGRTEVGLGPQDSDDGTGSLIAWDPVTQTKRWEVRYSKSFWNGGVLTTAGGLVFQGTGAGQLWAYDARSGNRLWSFDAGLGIIAAPMTYELDGVQYLSVLVGYGGGINAFPEVANQGWHYTEQTRRLLTFAVDRHTPLPSSTPPRFNVKAADDPKLVIDDERATKGAAIYPRCLSCHGLGLQSVGSFAPDLRESTLALNWDAFQAVVQGGAMASTGMPRFDDLSTDDLRNLFMYVRRGARSATHALK